MLVAWIRKSNFKPAESNAIVTEDDKILLERIAIIWIQILADNGGLIRRQHETSGYIAEKQQQGVISLYFILYSNCFHKNCKQLIFIQGL